jgi:hypothetical protein
VASATTFAALLVITVPAAPALASHPDVTVTVGPIFQGQLATLFPELDITVAGDPSIIKDGEGDYRMYYACYGFNNSGVETCLAESDDGIEWEDADVGDELTLDKGQVLFGESGDWDHAHETPYAFEAGGLTLLAYVGYEDAGDGFFGNPEVPVGLAVSSNETTFSRLEDPILEPTANTLDDHGMTSPSVFLIGSTWYMVYTGWCLENTTVCPRLSSDRSTATLVATSSDAENWTKSVYGNLIPDNQLPTWAPNGIAETHVFEAPGEGGIGTVWVMLFTGLGEGGPVGIGMAVRDDTTPVGAWDVYPDPLIEMEDLETGWPGEDPVRPVAPHGLVEGGDLRIWFAGYNEQGFKIGYAEALWSDLL